MTRCRLCGSTALGSVVDLGATPPCESFLAADELDRPEPTYPLHLRVCTDCWLAQIPPLITPEETFTQYAYFSSYSTSWVDHARTFVAGAVERLELGPDAFVVEVASNDGYLLGHVVERGIRCLGIEPSVNVGAAAREKGVPTLTEFLDPATGAAVRAEHGPADLVVANNVYAHIPDVVGFTRGLRALVADDGWVSIEVQHLLTLIEENQYDTIYHEHFQYYTVASAARALAGGGLTLVDVELLPTHGGSIRLWARPAEVAGEPTRVVAEVLDREKAAGLQTCPGTPSSPPGWPRCAGTSCASWSRRPSAARRSSATAPRARGTPCSTTAASGPTCSRTRSTGTPTSTAGSPRAPASRSCRPSRSPPTGRTTSSSSPGTCGPSWSSSCPICTSGAAGWSSPSRN